MKHASELFSADDRCRVKQAVADAESRTSAEIVPAVATASGRYDRPEDIIGLWCGVLMMLVTWRALPAEHMQAGSWNETTPAQQIAVMIVSLIFGFIFGAILGSRVGWLRRLFTSRRQMHEEVFSRAKQVFFDARTHRTTGATGLLIYVSVFERMAAIVADQTTLEKLGQGTLNELCDALTRDLKRLRPTEAICRAISLAGQKLAPVLPRADDDVNELSDALVILE